MTTIVELGKILGTLLEVYPVMKRKMDEGERVAMFKAYHLILGDLDAELLMQVALNLAGGNTFYPSAGELRNAYFDLLEQAAGIPDATQAWGEIKALLRGGFWSNNPPPTDSVSHPRVLTALEDIGGWLSFGESGNGASDRARYLQSYQNATKRDRDRERMLPGVMETARRLSTGQHKAIAEKTGS